MRVATNVDRPVFASIYEVAGRFLLFRTSEEETAVTIRQFLARWELMLQTDFPARTCDTSIFFEIGDLPQVDSGEPLPVDDGVYAFTNASAYTIRFPNALLSADQSNVIRVWLEQPLTSSNTWLPQIISHSLSAALRRCGVFELHSAAVVDNDWGHALLICGPSGSGKSTLTLQLAAVGWSYLSDDVVLLSTEKSTVRVSGLRRFFALTRDTVTASGLPEITGLLDLRPKDLSGKLPLLPQDLFPNGAIKECVPDVIVFPVISHGSVSTTRDLSASESMSRLIRLCPWSCYDSAIARSFLDTLAQLVKQSTSFELVAGTDLLGNSAYTSEFLRTTFVN
ncbi:MAG TPA: hypothetical protein VJ023_20595 [Pyrinomonadaceae bacterium]|nr:hypothetical protein [Pyrinomonadaceae bacterium]